MLYEDNPQDTRIYDPETGMFLTDETAKAQEIEESQTLTEGQAFKELLNNNGWKILEKWLTDCVEQYKEALVSSDEIEKIVRYQEATKCYQSLINYPKIRILQAQRLQEQRTRLVEDQAVNP